MLFGSEECSGSSDKGPRTDPVCCPGQTAIQQPVTVGGRPGRAQAGDPLPRPRRRAESPGRPSLSLPSVGHPRTQRTPPPPQSGPLASHRDQRDVRGAAATTSKPAPKPSWAGPRPAFILGGGLPGVTGRRTNLVGGRLPPGHAPRPAWDTGATS